MKNIHYCWFGPNELEPLNYECISTWSKYASSANIIKWNEDNSPVDIPIVKQALKDKKWAFASDYVRLWAIYNYGGIYLDTDIELIKNIEHLFDIDCFFGYQDEILITNGVMGAKKGNILVRRCIERMENNFKKGIFEISPIIVSETLKSNKNYPVIIFPFDAFYPYKPNRDAVKQLMFKNLTSNTLAIHHWQHSWKLSLLDRLKIIFRKRIHILKGFFCD
ncbi:polysaccharide biosynthesis protein [Photobacterium damselae subsp. damselae]|uniref:glycosyltransferase family 32 protein n=1 Tax=Photobacterium damselae TaxID=38293 RepID=UPI000D067D5F|nr:glycosyltransferase [Photobacterium damselae]PSB87043.1 polysaccharide biosynthesis protein [Photobacterium damselae subsp. damselae]